MNAQAASEYRSRICEAAWVPKANNDKQIGVVGKTYPAKRCWIGIVLFPEMAGLTLLVLPRARLSQESGPDATREPGFP